MLHRNPESRRVSLPLRQEILPASFAFVHRNALGIAKQKRAKGGRSVGEIEERNVALLRAVFIRARGAIAPGGPPWCELDFRRRHRKGRAESQLQQRISLFVVLQIRPRDRDGDRAQIAQLGEG